MVGNYISKVDYNVMSDGPDVFDQPVKNDLRI